MIDLLISYLNFIILSIRFIVKFLAFRPPDPKGVRIKENKDSNDINENEFDNKNIEILFQVPVKKENKNEKILEEEKKLYEMNKNINERNINYNFNHELRSLNNYENPLILKKNKNKKFELQDNNSMNIQKNRTKHNTNKNKNITNDKNIKEKSNESSMNLSKKIFENKNKKINNLKKPLSHSNSTRDIYTANLNIKK